MKRAILMAACTAACLSLAACATTSTAPPGKASPAAEVDARAIGAETAVTALAIALQVYASDPAVDLDRAKGPVPGHQGRRPAGAGQGSL